MGTPQGALVTCRGLKGPVRTESALDRADKKGAGAKGNKEPRGNSARLFVRGSPEDFSVLRLNRTESGQDGTFIGFKDKVPNLLA